MVDCGHRGPRPGDALHAAFIALAAQVRDLRPEHNKLRIRLRLRRHGPHRRSSSFFRGEQRAHPVELLADVPELGQSRLGQREPIRLVRVLGAQGGKLSLGGEARLPRELRGLHRGRGLELGDGQSRHRTLPRVELTRERALSRGQAIAQLAEHHRRRVGVDLGHGRRPQSVLIHPAGHLVVYRALRHGPRLFALACTRRQLRAARLRHTDRARQHLNLEQGVGGRLLSVVATL
mmetsp:Transcript_24989/g.63377  ORF Transcript_24989/g.63377 Transcript_24989/m.63377 type:complete len:234 (-) Transcript_24989:212-913(-)